MFITGEHSRTSRGRCGTAWRSSASGYTEIEKLNIAKKYLCESSARQPPQEPRRFSDSAILATIRHYARKRVSEPRARDRHGCRKVAVEVVRPTGARSVSAKNLQKYLGAPKFRTSKGERRPGRRRDGISMWAGELLAESHHHAGKGEADDHGKLGDMMQKSAQAAMSYGHALASSGWSATSTGRSTSTFTYPGWYSGTARLQAPWRLPSYRR